MTSTRPSPPATLIGRELAEFVVSTRLADIPGAVREAVQLHILDQVGVQLACSSLPTTGQVLEYARLYGTPGSSTVLGTGERFDAEATALVNGTGGHGFEMDDYTTGTMAHPGCVVVPAAFAVGESLGSTGAEVLLATCVGFEVVIRIARATMPSMLLERAFHQTAVHGVFGAAVAAASLMAFDVHQIEMALAIAASHASGIAEYDQNGGSVKRLHAGMGASGGIRSARLARLGITGPPTAIEGERGFLHAFVPDPHAERVTHELGRSWLMLDHLALKPYCCAASTHCGIDALNAIMARDAIHWSDIAAIRVGANKHFLVHVGEAGPEPEDLTQAQFSAHFALGLAAVKGANDFATYVEASQNGFRDPDVIGVARRVTLEYDDEVEQDMPNYLGKVTVTTNDGTEHHHRTYARGSRQRPLTHQEVVAKFEANAEAALPAEKIARARTELDGLAETADLTALMSSLVP